MALIDELKNRRNAAYNTIEQIEGRISEEQASLKRVAIGVKDLERAIAALEPAPDITFFDIEPVSVTIEAPTSSPSTDEGRSDPGSEENAGTNSDALAEFVNAEPVLAADLPKVELKWNDGFGPAEDADEEDASSDDEDDWDDEPEVQISILTGDPAISPESGLHGEPEPIEIDAEPASVLNNPDFVAAVSRAEAKLAIDAQTCEPIYPHPQPAYVGLQDADLDADYDAMREREKADKPKLHFSIFGERGNRKLEEV